MCVFFMYLYVSVCLKDRLRESECIHILQIALSNTILTVGLYVFFILSINGSENVPLYLSEKREVAGAHMMVRLELMVHKVVISSYQFRI